MTCSLELLFGYGDHHKVPCQPAMLIKSILGYPALSRFYTLKKIIIGSSRV